MAIFVKEPLGPINIFGKYKDQEEITQEVDLWHFALSEFQIVIFAQDLSVQIYVPNY